MLQRSVTCFLFTAALVGATTADRYDLCALAASGNLAILHQPDFTAIQPMVESFYGATGCSPAWSENGAATGAAREMISRFQNADAKGLNPVDYDGPAWSGRLAKLSFAPEPVTVTGFDLAITVSAMRYLSDLRYGRWNPGATRPAFEIEAVNGGLPTLVRRLAEGENADAILRLVEPPYSEYRRAEAALARFLVAAHDADLPALPMPPKTVGAGGQYEASALLASRLRQLGDLAPDEAVNDQSESSLYTKALSAAVARFQSRHGLEADGRLGRATVGELNTSLARRVQQLQLTLERWRWLPHSFRRPPIVVNIPEFALRAYSADYTPELTMKVIVGKTAGHQTPVFDAEMKYVVVHPYWEVPYDIQRDELVPKAMRDPQYLEKNGYEVVTARGAPVDDPLDADTLRKLKTGAYRIRQQPGPKNALGAVKFLFPNEHDVYLHGTPERGLFSLARRDFSHGCIRLQKPELLADWVLRDNPKWTADDIHDALGDDGTVTITLAKPIPVLIVYATAAVMENGEVHFFPDIYGQDAGLAAKFGVGAKDAGVLEGTDTVSPLQASLPRGLAHVR